MNPDYVSSSAHPCTYMESHRPEPQLSCNMDRKLTKQHHVGRGQAPPPVQHGFVPSPYDVLCGRGIHSLKNNGNIRFRSIVKDALDAYLDAKTKAEKARIVTSIIKQIHRYGGRFVRHDEATNDWYEITLHQTRDKVGHALRDAKQKRNKQRHYEEEQEQSQTTFEELLWMQRQIFQELLWREHLDHNVGTKKGRREATKSNVEEQDKVVLQVPYVSV